MSNYVIAFNKKAQEDIDIIAEYVFRFTFDYYTSEKLVRDMYSTIYSLQLFPYRFKEYKNDIRVIIIRGKYKVFYLVDEKTKKVTIYRIFSGLQNYENII